MKTPDSEKLQQIVKWMIVLFLGYTLWNSAFHSPKPLFPVTAPKNNDSGKTADCPSKLSEFPLFNIDLVPRYIPTVRIENTKPGDGAQAICGQKATYSYEYTVRQKVVDKGEKTIIIGGGDALHGTELGLIGMKPGGERLVGMPPELAISRNGTEKLPPEAKGQVVSAKLALKELSSALPSPSFPLRAIDDQVGSGMYARCGDEVSADLSVWKVDGTKVYSTAGKPVTFVIGSSVLPYGIEAGTIGMLDNSGRLIVMPPAYSEPLAAHADGDKPPAYPLPRETLLVQISNLHVNTSDAEEAKAPSATPTPAPKPSATPTAKPADVPKKP